MHEHMCPYSVGMGRESYRLMPWVSAFAQEVRSASPDGYRQEIMSFMRHVDEVCKSSHIIVGHLPLSLFVGHESKRPVGTIDSIPRQRNS
jgi:hypothetical protein